MPNNFKPEFIERRLREIQDLLDTKSAQITVLSRNDDNTYVFECADHGKFTATGKSAYNKKWLCPDCADANWTKKPKSYGAPGEGRARKEQQAQEFISLLKEQGYTRIKLDFDKLHVHYVCTVHGQMTRKHWYKNDEIKDRNFPACWHCGRGQLKKDNARKEHERWLVENRPHIRIIRRLDTPKPVYEFECAYHGQYETHWDSIIKSPYSCCTGCMMENKKKKKPTKLLAKLNVANCELAEPFKSGKGIRNKVRCILHDRIFTIIGANFMSADDRDHKCPECRTLILGEGTSFNRSIKEAKVFNGIQKKFPKALASYCLRVQNKGRLEIDILIEERGIGIEYNGTWFHSSKSLKFDSVQKLRYKHFDKFQIARDNNIQLLSIWEHLSERENKPITNLRLKEELDLLKSECTNKHSFCGFDRTPNAIREFYNKSSPLSVRDADRSYVCLDEHGNAVAAISIRSNTIVNLASKIRYQTTYPSLFKMFLKECSPAEVNLVLPNDWYTNAIPKLLGFEYFSDLDPCGFVLHGKLVTKLGRKVSDQQVLRLTERKQHYVYFDSGSTRWKFRRN